MIKLRKIYLKKFKESKYSNQWKYYLSTHFRGGYLILTIFELVATYKQSTWQAAGV